MLVNKLAKDEAQRATNYEVIKANAQTEVSGLNQEAVAEVIDTKREIEGSRFFARISQIVDYIFFYWLVKR